MTLNIEIPPIKIFEISFTTNKYPNKVIFSTIANNEEEAISKALVQYHSGKHSYCAATILEINCKLRQ